MKNSGFVQVHPLRNNQAIAHTLLLASNLHANESTKAGTLYSHIYRYSHQRYMDMSEEMAQNNLVKRLNYMTALTVHKMC